MKKKGGRESESEKDQKTFFSMFKLIIIIINKHTCVHT